MLRRVSGAAADFQSGLAQTEISDKRLRSSARTLRLQEIRQRSVLSQGCLGELVIKGPARLTALAKPCSLLGRNSGFIGSRVEKTEARINRKYRNSLRSLRENCVILE
jgi:hypothetical protein